MHPQGISLIQLFEINSNLPAHISRPHTLSQASSKKTTARWVGWGKVLSQTQPERCARYWKQDFGKYKEFIKK
jgi:hypothetical protein